MTHPQSLVQRLTLIRADLIAARGPGVPAAVETQIARLATAITQAAELDEALVAARAEVRFLHADNAVLRMRQCAAVAEVVGE